MRHLPIPIRLPGRLRSDDLGATAVEYALLASAIAGVIATTVLALGPKVVELFERLVWP